MENQSTPDTPKPLSQRTDEEIRDRARELFDDVVALDIPPDGQVIRVEEGRVALVEAVIYLGESD